MSILAYGTCPCAGVYDQRTVEVRMKVGDAQIVLDDIPQGACPKCGSRVYKAEVLEMVEALTKWDGPQYVRLPVC